MSIINLRFKEFDDLLSNRLSTADNTYLEHHFYVMCKINKEAFYMNVSKVRANLQMMKMICKDIVKYMGTDKLFCEDIFVSFFLMQFSDHIYEQAELTDIKDDIMYIALRSVRHAYMDSLVTDEKIEEIVTIAYKQYRACEEMGRSIAKNFLKYNLSDREFFSARYLDIVAKETTRDIFSKLEKSRMEAYRGEVSFMSYDLDKILNWVIQGVEASLSLKMRAEQANDLSELEERIALAPLYIAKIRTRVWSSILCNLLIYKKKIQDVEEYVKLWETIKKRVGENGVSIVDEALEMFEDKGVRLNSLGIENGCTSEMLILEMLEEDLKGTKHKILYKKLVSLIRMIKEEEDIKSNVYNFSEIRYFAADKDIEEIFEIRQKEVIETLRRIA